MKARWILMLSVVVNLGLAVGWIAYAHRERLKLYQEAERPEALAVRYKTNVLVRHQFFSWDQIESSDYPTYVANLRAVGCPEQTVRDIIIADVNTHYAHRLAREVLTPEQQWWRTDTDTNVQAIAEAKAEALDGERRTLLVQLLGPDWESGDLINLPRPSQATLMLDGPVLGLLQEDVKQKVEQMGLQGQKRLEDYLTAQQAAGKDPDPAMMTKLDEQTRLELASVLSPQQVEEYELRYSATAEGVRDELGDLKYFNATPEEFQKLYHVVSDINDKIAAISDTDPNAAAIREGLENQQLAATKAALGDARFAEYLKLHDPDYQTALSMAQAAGNPQSADTIYQVNRASAQEQDSIQSNTNLTTELKTVAQKSVELDQAQGNAAAVGQLQMDAPPAPPPPPMPTSTYTLSIGENLNTVSQRSGVPINIIQQLNPNLDLTTIRPGDKLQLPAR